MKVFGRIACTLLPDLKKLDQKTFKFRFMGYILNHKGYSFYDEDSKTVIISRDELYSMDWILEKKIQCWIFLEPIAMFSYSLWLRRVRRKYLWKSSVLKICRCYMDPLTFSDIIDSPYAKLLQLQLKNTIPYIYRSHETKHRALQSYRKRKQQLIPSVCTTRCHTGRIPR